MKLLLAHDGTTVAETAIGDFRRAGLPDTGNALILWPDGDNRQENHKGGGADYAVRQIQSLLPEWQVSVERTRQTSAEAVLRTAAWWSPDLLVVGCCRRPEVPSQNMPFDVVHRARCSVRMVTPAVPANHGPIRVIIADDGSAGAQSAVRTVKNRSWPADTEVRVLGVDADPQSGSLDPLRDLGVKVSEMRIDGDPREALVREAEAWHADALFLGAHGASAANRFLLGSVSTAVVLRLRRTVEVVR